MFYLEDANGNVVRAINWVGNKITFVYRHDTRRVESCYDLSFYEEEGIEITVLESFSRKSFEKKPIQPIDSNLRLVQHAGSVLKNVDLPKDEPEKFKAILKKVSLSAAGVAVLLIGLSFVIHPQAPVKEEELQVVQVMDRKQIEKAMVLPPTPQKQRRTVTPKAVVKHTLKPKAHKIVARSQNSGVLGVLGSLKKSNQQGGLKLSQADTSAGIGRGGSEGSGGMQTSVYSKGMFASPLGTGGKVNGGGGYGTKGKGGGRAGYGQVSLIGAGNSFFQPVESEAWVEGGLDRNEIAAVIQRHLSEVRFCYEKGLQQKPNLSGRLSMKFMIGPRGSVTLAQVQNSSLDHAPVENCIRDHLKTWNFPQPQGGVTVKVSYPFILRRVSDS